MDYSTLPRRAFRDLLLNSREFLMDLFKQGRVKNYAASRRELMHASDSDLQLLLCIIKKIHDGEITISRTANTRINRSPKARDSFNKMANRRHFEALRTSPRKTQVNHTRAFGFMTHAQWGIIGAQLLL